MLVVRKPSVHLPTLTQRSLYAPYADEHLAGTNLAGDRMLLNVKGYWPSLLVARRVVLRDLFAPDAPTERQTALARLEAMDRPIAVVVEESRDAGLSTFLQSTANSTRIYGGEGLTVWLLGRPHPMVASVLKD